MGVEDRSSSCAIAEHHGRFVVEPLACPLVIEVRSIIQSQQFGASLRGGGVGGWVVGKLMRWRTGKAHV